MFILYDMAPLITMGTLVLTLTAVSWECFHIVISVESAPSSDYQPLQTISSSCIVAALVTVGAPLWMLYGPSIGDPSMQAPLPARLALFCLAAYCSWRMTRDMRFEIDMLLVARAWSRPRPQHT